MIIINNDFQNDFKELLHKYNLEIEDEKMLKKVIQPILRSDNNGDLSISRDEEMEQLRRKKRAHGRKLSNNRRKLSTDVQKRKTIRSKETELRRRFSNIMKEDRHNAEIHYRYAFFLMELEEWEKAIHYFQQALKINNYPSCTYPLEKAQLLKAHMFIGTCSGKILKESLTQIDKLQIEKSVFDYDLEVEGKSIEQVLTLLKNESEQYIAYCNNVKKIISTNEYLQIKGGLYPEKIFISFVESEIFVKIGSRDERIVTAGMREWLKYKVDKIIEKGHFTYDDLLEYEEGRSWESCRRTISRINDLVKFEDERSYSIFEQMPATSFELNPKGYKLADHNFIFIFRQSDFIEEDIEQFE